MVLMLGLMFGDVVEIWVGDAVRVDSDFVMYVGIFTIVSVWNNVYAMLSNGIGKVKLQMITALTGMLLNVPLALVFVKYFGMGVEGVVLANVICLLFGSVALPIQMYFILRK
jgi:Na+-driven multidrug efflux pump